MERGSGRIDVHELLKREAMREPNGAPGAFTGTEPPRGEARIRGRPREHVVVLDSFEKSAGSDLSRGEIRWDFRVQGETADMAVGLRAKPEGILAVRLGTFVLPQLPEVPFVTAAVPAGAPTGRNQLVLLSNHVGAPAGTPLLIPSVAGTERGQYPSPVLLPANSTVTPWICNPYTQLPFGGRLTIQIREAGVQSYSGRGGARHNFEFAAEAVPIERGGNPNMLVARPASGDAMGGGGGWDTFTFDEPLSSLHGVSLVFRNPDIPIRFDPDVFYGAEINWGGGANPTLRLNIPGHGLQVGDRIYISGFTGGDPRLAAYVNRPEGHVAAGPNTVMPAYETGSVIPGDLVWTDPAISLVDISSGSLPVLPQRVDVYVAKRRIRIPMRIICTA